MQTNNYCVIMAGGTGSRFWPLSRQAKPKQFLDILGTGKSLIRQTFERMNRLFPAENFYIVTSDEYKDDILAHIPELKDEQVLLEPSRRNTAPCIAYANFKIQQANPEANIVVAPADHLILNEGKFIEILTNSLEFTAENDVLMTLGITPSRPETGYGYIQADKSKSFSQDNQLFRVKTFTEKPNHEIAKAFYESGEYYWNSGIFIWSLKSIMDAFYAYLPEVNHLFKQGEALYNTPKERGFIEKTYATCPTVSIDVGVMEKAEQVFVYTADFGWSDLGTWGSLYENSTPDDNENVINQGNVITYEAHSNIVRAPKDKVVVLEGLEDYIVIDTEDALLIVSKKEEQQIKRFVADVKLKTGQKHI